jgi:hypothetical protein
MHTGLKVNGETTYQRSMNKGAMTLHCKLCDEPIKFDDDHTSERTGKKIPLDIDTDQPHYCIVWRSQQEQRRQTHRRYYICRKGCGRFIYFDENERTESGKWFPLEKETGLPHQCK